MVNIFEQVKDILLTFLDESMSKKIAPLLLGMSYQMLEKNQQYYINSYNENRFDFLKEYYQLEIQKVCQPYTNKKIKRLATKMKEGNAVFIRFYKEQAESIDDFQYVQVQQVSRNRLGFKELTLSNGRKIARIKLKKELKKVFKLYNDWVVFEDLNFRVSETIQQQEQLVSAESLYLERLYQRLWCMTSNKLVDTFDQDKRFRVEQSFIEQRKYVYSIIKNCPTFSKELEKYMQRCMKVYEKKEITWKEMCSCLIAEYQLLKKLTGKEMQEKVV